MSDKALNRTSPKNYQFEIPEKARILENSIIPKQAATSKESLTVQPSENSPESLTVCELCNGKGTTTFSETDPNTGEVTEGIQPCETCKGKLK